MNPESDAEQPYTDQQARWENTGTAVDHWYTEPWTLWRILELWARCGVALLWLGLVTILAGQVSESFLLAILYTGLALMLLDAVLPDGTLSRD